VLCDILTRFADTHDIIVLKGGTAWAYPVNDNVNAAVPDYAVSLESGAIIKDRFSAVSYSQINDQLTDIAARVRRLRR
jgi:hypothetical protein